MHCCNEIHIEHSLKSSSPSFLTQILGLNHHNGGDDDDAGITIALCAGSLKTDVQRRNGSPVCCLCRTSFSVEDD